MTEIRHTPKPWTYRKARKHFHIEASAPGYGSLIGTVSYSANGDTGWTSEANVRLMVKSPELVDTLETVLVRAEHMASLLREAGFGLHDAWDTQTFEKAHDLIREALGHS